MAFLIYNAGRCGHANLANFILTVYGNGKNAELKNALEENITGNIGSKNWRLKKLSDFHNTSCDGDTKWCRNSNYYKTINHTTCGNHGTSICDRFYKNLTEDEKEEFRNSMPEGYTK